MHYCYVSVAIATSRIHSWLRTFGAVLCRYWVFRLSPYLTSLGFQIDGTACVQGPIVFWKKDLASLLLLACGISSHITVMARTSYRTDQVRPSSELSSGWPRCSHSGQLLIQCVTQNVHIPPRSSWWTCRMLSAGGTNSPEEAHKVRVSICLWIHIMHTHVVHMKYYTRPVSRYDDPRILAEVILSNSLPSSVNAGRSRKWNFREKETTSLLVLFAFRCIMLVSNHVAASLTMIWF